MQRMTGLRSGSAVKIIINQRMTNISHVHADLVRAAGEDVYIEEGEAAARIGMDGRVAGDGFPASGLHGHTGFARGMPGERRVDFPRRGARRAVREGRVRFFHLPAGKLFGQAQAAFFGAGDEQKSAGVLIQAVHNAGRGPS